MFLPAGDLLNLPSPAEGAKLHILAIGVEQYERATLQPLQYAARDAAAFAKVLSEQGRGSYSDIWHKVLVNDEAHRSGILGALDALAKTVGPQDVTVIFLAGHGVRHPNTRAYCFAPFDLDQSSYSRSAIEGVLICRALWNLPGRRLLVVDTCNAGNVAAELEQDGNEPAELHSTLLREMGSTRRNVRVNLSDPSSLAVLMATGRDGAAVESVRWEGGVFTYALLEGLQGGGDNGTGAITLRSLCSYVKNRVRSLTRNQQEPRFAVAGGAEEDYEILRLSPERTKPALRSGDELVGKSICGFRILARIEQTPRHVLYSGMSESPAQSAIQLRALSRELSRNPSEVQRFHLSARMLRQLKSPHFVEVYELGKLPDGRAHVIFGAAGRRRLRDVLECGALPPPAAIRLLRFVATALGTAHRAGVLYFSLSPSRVLVDDELDQFQLYDGENACPAANPAAPASRAAGDPLIDEMDSAHYRAPECDDPAAEISAQVDVYALGVLAFHVLTGRTPYSGETVGQLVSARRKGPPSLPVLDLADAGLLTELVQRMLAPDPQQRPSMAEIESALRGLDGCAPAAGPGVRPESTSPQTAPAPQGVPDPAQAPTVRLKVDPRDLKLPAPPPMPPQLPVSPQLPQPAPPPAPQPLEVALAPTPGGTTPPPARAPMPVWLQRPATCALALCGGLAMLIAASAFAFRLLERSPDSSQGAGEPPVGGTESRPGRGAPPPPVKPAAPQSAALPSEICLPGGTLPPGRGRPEQAETLRIAPYCLDRTEVTNQAFLRWLAQGSGGKLADNEVRGPGGELWLRIGSPLYVDERTSRVRVPVDLAEHPIAHVTWEGARAYCSAQGRRLPTEGQWLFAALAAGPAPSWPWGQETPGCGSAAVAGLCLQARQQTVRVGSTRQDHTPSGIDDLLGNVAEWVETRTDSERRTGHSFLGRDYRSPADRWWQQRRAEPAEGLPYVGFRCARPDTQRRLAQRFMM